MSELRTNLSQNAIAKGGELRPTGMQRTHDASCVPFVSLEPGLRPPQPRLEGLAERVLPSIVTVPPIRFSDSAILAARPAKNDVDSTRPYAFLVEPERTARGTVEDVATIFLTNRECPFRCLMCDLWENTLDETVPLGSIPAQIDYALDRLPATRHVKLYNSGNFFDAKAIPRDDLPAIAERVRDFDTVIVENHPRLCGDACVRFRDLLETNLEIALGLETIHPDLLPALNKRMTLDDFERAVGLLVGADIAVRAFVLLGLPWLEPHEAIDWALRSVEFAFSIGVGCCSLIPTRAKHGLLSSLANSGHFQPPSLASLETTATSAVALGSGRAFVDLWDVQRLESCPACAPRRIERMHTMNLTQKIPPPVQCERCETRR
jgi:radical SAM enzyme (TIGR01210 family)